MLRKARPKFTFPRSKVGGLDFSFSGLKTAILYFLRDQIKADPDFLEKEMKNICASVQKTIVDTLISKLKIAADQTGIKAIAIAGGVSANSGLRTALEKHGQ